MNRTEEWNFNGQAASVDVCLWIYNEHFIKLEM